ncbi:FAD-dependent oxidoreductase [Actinoplanes sp. NPDC049265]|uniref:FAD-dependent oxidoreductase n=1 Tax=Actinoplanes sp. NPDC049265 TaxID=3363902 RepID=UPI003711E861
MSESLTSAFDRLVDARPPARPTILFDTATVLGGSIAGLLAARVLADHAGEVVIVERDELPAKPRPRPGTPQDQQVHTLLPAGHQWIERWLPGFTADALERGALLSGPDTTSTAFDGHRQVRADTDFRLFVAGRPLIETVLREHVIARPNVSVVRGRVTGLRFADGAVSGVAYYDGNENGNGERVLATDFTVDATGRASRVPAWLSEHGYDEPELERLAAPINYATALFHRDEPASELEVACALGLFAPGQGVGGVSVAAANAVEDDQWIVMLMGYDDARPGRTLDQFREITAGLPGVFGRAAAGAVTREIVTYHQAESRRRDFTGVRRFPAGLVSVGDAVASFNPVYGQGMSSAALHASCLSAHLTDGPDLAAPATGFFERQRLVVDAAWAISAGGDAERLDAVTGAAVPEEVSRQRQVLRQIVGATLVDPAVATAFNNVSYMLRHPATLADPAIVERAAAATG